MLLTSIWCQHTNIRSTYLVGVIQMPICMDDKSSVSRETQNITYGTSKWSPTYWTDTSQWRYHNCRCVTRAVEKFELYSNRIGTVPTAGSSKKFLTMKWIHTTSSGTHDCFQTIIFYICCSCNYEMSMVWLFDTLRLLTMKNVWKTEQSRSNITFSTYLMSCIPLCCMKL